MPEQQNQQEIEKMVKDYQVVQEQLRVYSIQLEQLKAQKSELGRAKEEVEKSTGKVYLTVGGVIVESTKDKAVADLKDRSELSDTRIASITKQFNDIKVKEKSLSEKITSMYKAAQQGATQPAPQGIE